MTSYDRQTAWVIGIAVLARLVYFFGVGFTADDAFITFRYAENIASGLGFVYNQGEHVLGTTTPLFTLILSFLSFFGIPLIYAALLVSLVASGATAAMTYRLAVLLRMRHLAFLPALCIALWPRSLPADTGGMETAMFTALVTAAFYFNYRRFDFYAIGMGTLAVLARPEGVLALGLVLIANGIRHRDRILHYLFVVVTLIGPWVIFAGYYFGSPLPNTTSAKLALYSRFGTMPFWDSLSYLLALHSPIGWIMLILAPIGAVWLYKKQRFGTIELLWLGAMILLYALGKSRIFFWYIVPIYPLYLIFALAATMPVWDRLPAYRQLHRPTILTIGAAVAVILLVGNYGPAVYYQQYQQRLENTHKQIGYYLYKEASPGQLVAAEDIGYIGFYSRRRILDRDGLVSPGVIEYNRQGAYERVIEQFKPDWLVAMRGSPISGFIEDSTFARIYAERGSFGNPPDQYTVYQRMVLPTISPVDSLQEIPDLSK